MPQNLRNDLTAEYVRARLDYDPLTGIFTWRDHPDLGSRTDKIGKKAGAPRKGDGREVLTIKGNNYLAYRVAILHQTGEWPPETVDHKNSQPADSVFENIRKASYSQNAQNVGIRANNTSGYKGVTKRPHTNSWQAHITINNKLIYLGCREKIEDAAQLYVDAVAKYHDPEFARVS